MRRFTVGVAIVLILGWGSWGWSATHGAAGKVASLGSIKEIHRALRERQIDLRTSILLRAKLLFPPEAPEKLPRPGGSDSAVEDREDDLFELFQDVGRGAHHLNEADRQYLSSVDPSLAQVVANLGREAPEEDTASENSELSALDRVSEARELGQISDKEAVLLKAKLILAPHLVEPESRFAPRAGAAPASQLCLTGFFLELRKEFSWLTREEKDLLRSLDKNLEHLINVWDGERQGASGRKPMKALPSCPGCLKEVGEHCVGHYTLTSSDPKFGVPDITYVKVFLHYLDQAIIDMKKDFRPAYAEGGGKLHVFFGDTTDNGTNEKVTSSWESLSMVPGYPKRAAGVIRVDSDFVKSHLGDWGRFAKEAAYHEYFHGIQSAYNDDADLWFAEGTATWASGYYGHCYQLFKNCVRDPSSIFKKPNLNVWAEVGLRMYSTATLAYYLSDKFSGYKAILAYLKHSQNQDDAVKNLQKVLKDQGTDFKTEYGNFLAAMYLKDIDSIRSYMPKVKLRETFDHYGNCSDDTVYLTGANFYRCNPDAAAKGKTLMAHVTKMAKDKVPTPQAMLIKGENQDLSVFETDPDPTYRNGHPFDYAVWNYVLDFDALSREAVMIVTDADYKGKERTERKYQYRVLLPYFELKSFYADPPQVSCDGLSQYTEVLKYDFLGHCPDEMGWRTSYFPALRYKYEFTMTDPDLSYADDLAFALYPWLLWNSGSNWGAGPDRQVNIPRTAAGCGGSVEWKQELWFPADGYGLPNDHTTFEYRVDTIP